MNASPPIADVDCERLPVSAETCSVNGSRFPKTLFEKGLFFDHAEPRFQASLMRAIAGNAAPLDIHLDVPWCHPDDQNGTADDWTDCIYRVRPRAETGRRYRGRKVSFVGFERYAWKWFVFIQYARADV